MKRMMFLKRMVAMMAMVFSVAMFAACSDDDEPAVGVTGVTLDQPTLSLEIDETATLVATIAPANAANQSVRWTSSDETVATVDTVGLVTGVGIGSATITVTTVDGAKTATCEVTVDAGEPAVGKFYYSDGSFSATYKANKTLLGVVAYMGDLTADDAELAKAMPNGMKGLILSAKSFPFSSWSIDINNYVSILQEESGWTLDMYNDLLDYAKTNYAAFDVTSTTLTNGYSNTAIYEAYNAEGKQAVGVGWGWDDETQQPADIIFNPRVCALDTLSGFKAEFEAPEGTSDWYLPSVAEWELMVENLEAINASLNQVEGAGIVTEYDESLDAVENTFGQKYFAYWTSTTLEKFQQDPQNQWSIYLNDISYYYDMSAMQAVAQNMGHANMKFVLAF